jgi:hypothetical protein
MREGPPSTPRVLVLAESSLVCFASAWILSDNLPRIIDKLLPIAGLSAPDRSTDLESMIRSWYATRNMYERPMRVNHVSTYDFQAVAVK